MSNPRLRIRSTGLGGSGYVRPAIGDVPSQKVKNADSQDILALAGPDGKAIRYPGVTTVLKQLAKPQLDQWRADSVAARAVTNIDALLNRTELEGFDYLRFAADDVRNDAAEQGVWGHQWVQADLGVGGFYPEPETKAHEEMATVWEQFTFEHDIRNVRWAERTLGNLEHSYIGTADLLADIDDLEDCLIDIKTARSTWPDHWMQLSALMKAEFEVYELGGDGSGAWYEGHFETPKNGALIHLRPTDGPLLPFCNLLPLNPAKIDLYFTRFLASLTSAHAEYAMKKLEKELGE